MFYVCRYENYGNCTAVNKAPNLIEKITRCSFSLGPIWHRFLFNLRCFLDLKLTSLPFSVTVFVSYLALLKSNLSNKELDKLTKTFSMYRHLFTFRKCYRFILFPTHTFYHIWTLWVGKADSNIMCEMRRLEKNVNKEEMFFRCWDFLSNGGNISLAWEACKAERNVSVGKTEGK